jgi:hypothetical protein
MLCIIDLDIHTIEYINRKIPFVVAKSVQNEILFGESAKRTRNRSNMQVTPPKWLANKPK